MKSDSLMQTCTLLPNTKRLKQLIKEFGNEWSVVHAMDRVICFNNEPGFLITKDEHMRWVRPSDIKLK